MNPFDKHINPIDLPKKTGMNILLHADLNVVGRPTKLMRLINERTIHKARCIVASDDYLSYDKDIALSDGDGIDEAVEIVEAADFFHIFRQAVDFGDVNFYRLINKRNCVFQYGGSILRENGADIRAFHARSGIMPLVMADWTIWNELPGMYHINKICDVDSMPQVPGLKSGDTIKVSHCPTNRINKSTQLFLDVMAYLEKSCDVETVLIENVDNATCLQMRADAHIHYDRIKLGTYGMSGVEGMAMGQAVLVGMNNFTLSLYPEIPVINVTEQTLGARIRELLRSPGEIMECGLAGREWVKEHHSPEKILPKYLYLYDLVTNGVRNIQHRGEFLL